MFELLFLFAFTLHNIEEALWLPAWSRHAGAFHPAVEKNEFHFAVVIITAIGYLLTFAYMVTGETNEIVPYLYFGFVLMMCLNAVFPHLLATVFLRRYMPGTITGCLLNLPIGLYLVFIDKKQNIADMKLLIGFAIVTVIIISALQPLFKLGKRLLD